MKILVLYATSEGQTLKIAEYLAECLRQRGHAVVLADVTSGAKSLDLSAFDAAILASRVHAGRHHRAIVSFVRRYLRLLAAMDTAFVSVSMSAAHRRDEDGARLAQYRTEFVRATGWDPGEYHDVAGARLYTRHNRLTRWVLAIIDHNQFDPNKDHEFTDWLDLRSFIDGWVSRLESETCSGSHSAECLTHGPRAARQAGRSRCQPASGTVMPGRAIARPGIG